MPTTTTRSSEKEENTKRTQEKFDGLLDLISAKNVKIGRLLEELSLCRDLLQRISADVAEPVRNTIKNRVQNADDILRIATH